jgi:hypothetical protein
MSLWQQYRQWRSLRKANRYFWWLYDHGYLRAPYFSVPYPVPYQWWHWREKHFAHRKAVELAVGMRKALERIDTGHNYDSWF